jgi:hypothetical protein
MQCPVCKTTVFWAQDPDDEYERYRITVQGDRIVPDAATPPPFAISRDIHAHCDRCAWNGRLGDLAS